MPVLEIPGSATDLTSRPLPRCAYLISNNGRCRRRGMLQVPLQIVPGAQVRNRITALPRFCLPQPQVSDSPRFEIEHVLVPHGRALPSDDVASLRAALVGTQIRYPHRHKIVSDRPRLRPCLGKVSAKYCTTGGDDGRYLHARHARNDARSTRWPGATTRSGTGHGPGGANRSYRSDHGRRCTDHRCLGVR